MNGIRSSAKRLFALLGALLVTGTASASAVSLDQWYTFGFAGSGGDPLTGGTGYVLGLQSVAAGDPAWTFACGGPCNFTVTDGFIAVDRFELFDFGASLGLTSAPSGEAGHSCGNDELACLADAQMSHGSWILGAGNHSITGTHTEGIPGAGFFIIRAAPEPGTLALLGLGLAGMGLSRRRKAA